MKGICPNCEKETDIELIRTIEKVKVRGESIEVEMEFYRCLVCGEEFEDPHSDMRYALEEIWSSQEKKLGKDFIYKKLLLKDGTQESINNYLNKKEITYSYLFPQI
jgi:YgiT-type zinc finger domain-containing protein